MFLIQQDWALPDFMVGEMVLLKDVAYAPLLL